jgi:hypothetical protein
MAASGEIHWPPTGSFPWPPSERPNAIAVGRGAVKLVEGGAG